MSFAISASSLRAAAAAQWLRPVVDEVRLSLSMPPSTNKLWRPDGRGGLTVTSQYAAWKRTAAIEIAAQRPGRIEGAYALAVAVSSRHRRDLDNNLKALGDALQSSGVVTNDRLLSRLVVEWSDAIDGVEVVVVPYQKDTR